MVNPMQAMLDTLPQYGLVQWIGLRPARNQPMLSVEQVMAKRGEGLEGDRFSGSLDSKRQVTLIQQEHLTVIGACLHKTSIPPAMLRRNIVVSNLNLLALKGKQFQIGEAVLEFTGLCHPCSKMEKHLGPGGYNAMRGHGGINAKVIRAGQIKLADKVTAILPQMELYPSV